MSSIDDEFALFQNEISSLANAEEPPPAKKAKTTKPFVPAQAQRVPQAPPVRAPPRPNVVPMPPMMAGPSGIAPFAAPPMPGFVPPALLVGQMRPPMVPPPMNLFVPHQLRMGGPPLVPAARAQATIEAAPTKYEATDAAEPEVPQVTYALASDIEAMQAKRNLDAIEKKRSKEGGNDKKGAKFLRSGGGQVWEDKSLADWDQNDFRIFCGDLGNEVSDELLAKAFRKYPSFQRAKVIRDSRTNKSKGYGFVSFVESDDYIRAIREMDGKYVGNRPIKLRKSNWKERQFEVVKKKQKEKAKLGLWS